MATSRVAWLNGQFLPEKDVLIPFRDLGFLRGVGAYDMARTFGGVLHRMPEHVARLYRTLRYIDVDPGIAPAEMLAVGEKTLELNRPLLGATADYWVCMRVSGGLQAIGDEGWEHTGPNVIVECRPLPLRKWGPLFRNGIELMTSVVPRMSRRFVSPQGKLSNYLNIVLASKDVQQRHPKAWPLMLDEDGYLAEGEGCNVFLVSEGRLLTPTTRHILPGIRRDEVIALAQRLGIEVREADLDLFDAANADEIFCTSSGLCICPVFSFNGRAVGGGDVPGPVTRRLTEAFIADSKFDFVAQCLAADNSDRTT